MTLFLGLSITVLACRQPPTPTPPSGADSASPKVAPALESLARHASVDTAARTRAETRAAVHDTAGARARSRAKTESPVSAQRPALLEFGRGTCVPCKMMKPIIEELQREYGDRIEIAQIDVTQNQALTARFNIMMIPTQVLLDTTGREVFRHVGFFPKDSILYHFDRLHFR